MNLLRLGLIIVLMLAVVCVASTSIFGVTSGTYHTTIEAFLVQFDYFANGIELDLTSLEYVSSPFTCDIARMNLRISRLSPECLVVLYTAWHKFVCD